MVTNNSFSLFFYETLGNPVLKVCASREKSQIYLNFSEAPPNFNQCTG